MEFFTPFLVHRANLVKGYVKYQRMDHAEYNLSAVIASLNKLASVPQDKQVMKISVDRREVAISIIGPAGIVGIYSPYLQVMTNEHIHLKEYINMKKGVLQYLNQVEGDFPDTWHDMLNSIIFSCYGLDELEAAVTQTTAELKLVQLS